MEIAITAFLAYVALVGIVFALCRASRDEEGREGEVICKASS